MPVVAEKSVLSKEMQDAIDAAQKKLEKKFGEDARVSRLGDLVPSLYDGLSTGILSLDKALGGYGIPKGRVVEFYGAEASSKTTAAMSCICEAQKIPNKQVLLIDAEHAMDLDWARLNGVDVDNLLINQPSYGEQGLQTCLDFIETGAISLAVIDSVAALVPKKELEGSFTDAHVGLQGRMMGHAMRKFTATCAQLGTPVIFINQLRSVINKMGNGPNSQTPGGRALKFFASIRVSLAKIETLKKGEEKYGIKVKADVVKNKVAPAYRTAIYEVHGEHGIRHDIDIVECGKALGLVTGTTWLKYEGPSGEVKGQGMENFCSAMKESGCLEQLAEKVKNSQQLPNMTASKSDIQQTPVDNN